MTDGRATSNRVPNAEQIADAIAEWDTERILTAEQALDLAKFLVSPKLVVVKPGDYD